MKHMKLTTSLIYALALILCISCNKAKQSAENKTNTTSTNATPIVSGKIAYVEIDTIFKYYDMAKDLNETLDAKQKKLDADIKSKTSNFQSNYLDLQNKMQKGLITSTNAQEAQQQLASQEQGLYQLRDQYRSQLAEETQVNQRQIIQSIMDYLKEYNKSKGFQYILANSFPSSILYADTNQEITREVIEGLNARYKSQKGKK